MQKFIIYFFFFFLSGQVLGQSPSWIWAKMGCGGNGGSNVSNDITKDKYGNIYVIGSFTKSQIYFDTITLNNLDISNSGPNMFLLKYTSQGQILWGRNMGGYSNSVVGNGVKVDTSGNVYVVGTFGAYSSIVFGNDTLACLGGSKAMFIAKYDSLGNDLWGKTGVVSGTGGYSYGNDITIDKNNNIYVTGSYGGASINFGGNVLTNAGNAEAYIVKYDTLGNANWAKQIIGSLADAGTRIDADNQGNIIIAGNADSPSLNFGSLVINTAISNFNNLFFAKYDAMGNAIWANCPGAGSISAINGIATDDNNNIYLSGVYDATMNFGSGIFNTPDPNYGHTDMFLVKYDAAGNGVWGKHAGLQNKHDGANRVCYDKSDGSISTVGYFSSANISFAGVTLFNSNSVVTFSNIFILKHDTSGNLMWAQGVGSYQSENDKGVGVFADSGNVFLTGTLESSQIDFGSISVSTLGNDYSDVFVAKFGNINTGIEETVNQNSVFLYPNPAIETLTLEINGKNEMYWKISDITGRELIYGSVESKTQKIDISFLGSGVYFLYLLDKNRQKFSTKKLIKL
ncbi:MAG: T9SS type A sorting domain-containing protein [Bacteroidia bacterium]